jgi:Zn-dependent M28 family amino/carboxypeptidase
VRSPAWCSLTIPATPEPSSTSGCEAADFAGFTAGNIALVQRGTCLFADKVAKATAAGAIAVVIFNEGQPGRTEPFAGGLGGPVTVPVVGISYAEGVHFAELAAAGPVTARVETQTLSETRTTRNVIAETPGGRADNVVFAGAHLDSVTEGPGINDNGSGSAALLELGLKLGDERVKNKVRLAFWGGEEGNLLGSTFYVEQLSFEQQLDIALYLNFDMIGSPNWGEFIYDGDDSDGEGAGAGPFGSAQIEALISGYVETRKGVRPRAPTSTGARTTAVHRGRHPVRWHLHRGRGAEDCRAAGEVGRHGGDRVRPLLSPGL